MAQDRGRTWDGSGKPVFILAYLLVLALPCMGFLPNFWSRVLTLSLNSHTHQHITEQAIVNVTMETLRGIKNHQGSHAEEEVSRYLLYMHMKRPTFYYYMRALLHYLNSFNDVV